MKLLRDFGRGIYYTAVGIAIVAFLGTALAIANYAVTVGSGTNFGSIVVSSVHYAQQLVCDQTTVVQCVGVNASNQIAIQAPPSLPLPASAATSALQTTGNTSLATINTTLGSPFQAGGALAANQTINLNQMGGTSINSGCVAALSGFGTSIPSTVCGVFGAYVLNAIPLGQALSSASSPVVAPVLTVAGAAVVKGGVPVVNGGSNYLAVAASQTATVLQTSTGATGDYLSHCVVYPATTSPGVVTVFDSTNTAANSVILFAGGSTSLSNLTPIPVPVGANSVNGAWKVTTGANVSVVCYGKFS